MSSTVASDSQSADHTHMHADTDKDVRRLWFAQNPVTRNSLTGPDAKPRPGQEWSAKVGAAIGKFIGVVPTPLHRAQNAANAARIYKCPQSGESMTMMHLKKPWSLTSATQQTRSVSTCCESLVMCRRWSEPV